MKLVALYSQLHGSRGEFAIEIGQHLLNKICNLIVEKFEGQLQSLHVTPESKNRLRIKAKLPNSFLHVLGGAVLNVLHDDGIVIHISHPVAAGAFPSIDGWMDTTIAGSSVVPQIIEMINDALGVSDAIEIVDTKWKTWTGYRMHVRLHPMKLLKSLLPGGIGHHITRIRWRTKRGAFLIDVGWQHNGIHVKSTKAKKERVMNEELQALVDKLIASKFADLKGSTANLHLHLSEKLLNELLAAGLASQKDSSPWLSLVQAAHVKGAVNMEVKLSV